MALKIRSNSLFVNRYLKVSDRGVVFVETALLGGKRRFRYDQIDYILMSPSNVLSFQVGVEVFSVQTNPNRRRHQQAIEQMQRMTAGAPLPTHGFPVVGTGA